MLPDSELLANLRRGYGFQVPSAKDPGHFPPVKRLSFTSNFLFRIYEESPNFQLELVSIGSPHA